MERRPGQDGSKEYIEGGWYKIRIWVDIPGVAKRSHPGVRICPVEGPGCLTATQRKARIRELIAEHTGKNKEAVQSDGAVTFSEQAKIMMADLRNRVREPIAESTFESYERSLRLHLNPVLGDYPLCEIFNPQLKQVVHTLVKKGCATSSINKYINVAKEVVGSAVDPKSGEAIYPRKWKADLIDLPLVDEDEQNTPSFPREILTGLAAYHEPRVRMLFILAAAAGARIAELLGLEIEKHITPDFRTITIRQQAKHGKVINRVKKRASRREVDLDSEIAAVLRSFVGSRESGFVFETKNSTPISYEFALRHLHRALKALGYSNEKAKSGLAGTHAFRRARNTYLRNEAKCPDGLLKFWLGHASGQDMSDVYDQVKTNRKLRLDMAESCSHGFDLPSGVLLYRQTGGQDSLQNAA